MDEWTLETHVYPQHTLIRYSSYRSFKDRLYLVDETKIGIEGGLVELNVCVLSDNMTEYESKLGKVK